MLTFGCQLMDSLLIDLNSNPGIGKKLQLKLTRAVNSGTVYYTWF